jgi:hypothetical protein
MPGKQRSAPDPTQNAAATRPVVTIVRILPAQAAVARVKGDCLPGTRDRGDPITTYTYPLIEDGVAS